MTVNAEYVTVGGCYGDRDEDVEIVVDVDRDNELAFVTVDLAQIIRDYNLSEHDGVLMMTPNEADRLTFAIRAKAVEARTSLKLKGGEA